MSKLSREPPKLARRPNAKGFGQDSKVLIRCLIASDLNLRSLSLLRVLSHETSPGIESELPLGPFLLKN